LLALLYLNGQFVEFLEENSAQLVVKQKVNIVNGLSPLTDDKPKLVAAIEEREIPRLSTMSPLIRFT
jgi:hypothetical protein